MIYSRTHPPKGVPYTLCCIMEHHDQVKVSGHLFVFVHEHKISFSVLFLYFLVIYELVSIKSQLRTIGATFDQVVRFF